MFYYIRYHFAVNWFFLNQLFSDKLQKINAPSWIWPNLHSADGRRQAVQTAKNCGTRTWTLKRRRPGSRCLRSWCCWASRTRRFAERDTGRAVLLERHNLVRAAGRNPARAVVQEPHLGTAHLNQVVKDKKRRELNDLRIQVANEATTGEVLLDEALRYIKTETPPDSIANWIDLFSGTPLIMQERPGI